MKVVSYLIGILAVLISATAFAAGQTGSSASGPNGPALLTDCSPAPCVLPPTQASEGGALVNTPPIAANPLNPKQLLVGSDDFNCPNDGTGIHLSADGGSTWSVTCMAILVTENTFYEPSGEPQVGYDRNGVAYIASTYVEERYNLTAFIGFQRSDDGVHWSNPRVALNVTDTYAANTAFAVDTNAGSPYLNNLYVSAVVVGPAGVQSENRVVVSHSSDEGKTWKKAAVAPVQTSPDVDNYTSMTVGRDGTVYLTWMYCNSGPHFCEDDEAFMVFSKSTDGGKTWSKPRLMTTVVLDHQVLPNTSVGVTNYPAIGVDNSGGPNAGTIYVSMYNWTGTFMQVQVVRSTDGGTTWSKPVPVAPARYTHDQFFPWLSVSSAGLVGVSWLDRRNDPANIDYQAYAAISTDGGQSFQPNVQLTTAFSNPTVNGYAHNEWMGEYTGNTWDGPDYFVAAWMDSSNGINMQEVVGGIRLK
jgi:hypothetical protein